MQKGVHPRLVKPPKIPKARHERAAGLTIPRRLVVRDKEKEFHNASKQGKI